MPEKEEVTILRNATNNNEYVIKDKSKINIGRFSIITLDKENEKCDVTFKYYRKNNSKLLMSILEVMLDKLFSEKYIFKVNMLVSEDTEVNAFLNMGFVLEGIVSDSLVIQGDRCHEILLGINKIDYNSKKRISLVDISAKNIHIKLLTIENAEEVLDYYLRNKMHLSKFEPLRDKKFYTLETQKNIIQEGYRQFLNGSSMDCGIFINDKLIGIIKLSNVVYGIFKNGIIGYSIDKDEEGKGYMKEAVNALTKYAFREMKLHRIEASALVDNEKSKRVLLACGFEELGINKRYLFINGEWRDHITFYKTN